jgi:hypothetical protein
MPQIVGWSADPGTNCIARTPFSSGLTVNDSTTALLIAPAAEKMSKSVNTCSPFTTTLKSRLAGALKVFSAKCRRMV